MPKRKGQEMRGGSPFLAYLNSFFKHDTWDHYWDMRKAIPKGLASGANIYGQSVLGFWKGQNDALLRNRYARKAEKRLGRILTSDPGYKPHVLNEIADNNNRRYDSWSDWLSRAHTDAQKYWGEYKYRREPGESWFKALTSAPGQALHQTIGYGSPLLVHSAATGGAPTAAGALNMTRSRLGGAWKALSGMAKIGKTFPAIDRLTGMTHVQPGDGPVKAGLKRWAGKLVPPLVAVDPLVSARDIVSRHPDLYNGKVEGLARGAVEMMPYTSSPAGPVADAAVELADNAEGVAHSYGPRLWQSAKDFWEAFKNDNADQGAQILRNVAEGQELREAMDNTRTNNILTITGGQTVNSYPFNTRVARHVFGPVNPNKAAARGAWKATRGNADVFPSWLGIGDRNRGVTPKRQPGPVNPIAHNQPNTAQP